jgi:hypothetical protein
MLGSDGTLSKQTKDINELEIIRAGVQLIGVQLIFFRLNTANKDTECGLNTA